MHVALTGASGFLGAAIARHLAESGHTVAALVRASSRRDHIEPFVTRFVTGDQDDESAWPALLDGAECVIHNSLDLRVLEAGDVNGHLDTNLLASVRLLLASAPRQFVFMSSIAVHHDMRPRWSGLIDEDHPTRPGTLYGAAKAAVETHLWAEHFTHGRSVCAIRPCAVYGIDPTLTRSIGYPIIKRVRREHRFDKKGGGKFVHVDDVAALTVAAVGNDAAAGGVYNLADCYARWGDLAVMTRNLLGVEAQVDLSSPAAPANTFTKDAAAALGVTLDRGHEGLRLHMAALLERVDAEEAGPDANPTGVQSPA